MKALLLLVAIAGGGIAAPVLPTGLNFDNLKPGEQVLDYYDGGFGSLGSGPGPLAGITFTTGLAADATVIAFGQSALITGSSATMNLDTPWSGIISFYFEGNGSLSFYSGLNLFGTQRHRYLTAFVHAVVSALLPVWRRARPIPVGGFHPEFAEHVQDRQSHFRSYCSAGTAARAPPSDGSRRNHSRSADPPRPHGLAESGSVR